MEKQQIKDIADEVKTMTIEDAKKLPNMLGFIAPIELQKNGFYAYTVNKTKKVFIELAIA